MVCYLIELLWYIKPYYFKFFITFDILKFLEKIVLIKYLINNFSFTVLYQSNPEKMRNRYDNYFTRLNINEIKILIYKFMT